LEICTKLFSRHFLPESAPSLLVLPYKHLRRKVSYDLCAVVVSVFSWTVIISKARQLIRARKATKSFYERIGATRDPLQIFRQEGEVRWSAGMSFI